MLKIGILCYVHNSINGSWIPVYDVLLFTYAYAYLRTFVEFLITLNQHTF